jgi:hypothetical protein
VGERAADAAIAALKSGRPSASAVLEHRRATLFVPLENRLFRLAMFWACSSARSKAAASAPRRSSVTTF